MKRVIAFVLVFIIGVFMFLFTRNKTWLTKANYEDFLVIDVSQHTYSSIGSYVPGSSLFDNRYKLTVSAEPVSSDYEFHKAGVMVRVCFITANTIGDPETRCDQVYVEISEFGQGSTEQAGRSFLSYHRIDSIRVVAVYGYVKPIEAQ
ncbi:MAG: hypothetical protein KKE16_06235 [Firmicutes bacterium]|nr:hypothetical protein [Bacillota bacterium]